MLANDLIEFSCFWFFFIFEQMLETERKKMNE